MLAAVDPANLGPAQPEPVGPDPVWPGTQSRLSDQRLQPTGPGATMGRRN